MTEPTYNVCHEVMETPVGDEIVMLHLGNSTYYGLDPIGVRIWSLLKDGQGPNEIRDTLAKEYEVDREIIAADIARFLGELKANGIIKEA